MQYRVFQKFNIVYGEPMVSPQGRFSWPSLAEPKAPLPPKEGEKPGTPKYEVTLLLPKTDPQVVKFVKQLEKIAAEMVPLYNQRAQNEIAKVKRILRDGDQSDLEKYPNEEGHWLLTARFKDRPDILGKNQEEIAPDFIKGGMIGRLVVTPSLSAGGLGYGLNVVQFFSDDGVRFGGTKQDYRSLLEDLEGEDDGEEEKEDDEGSEESSTDEDSDDSQGETDDVSADDSEPKSASLSARDKARLQAEARAKASQKAAPKGGKGKLAAVNLL